MIDEKIINRALSLAGVFQTASLVKLVAKTGKTQEPYFTSSINTMFKIDADSVLTVYGGYHNLKLGLEELIRLFSNQKAPKDPDIARYVLSLLHLETKLQKNKQIQEILKIGIQRAANQIIHYSVTNENFLANLAGLYTDTLSNFKFRIFVSGEPLFLNHASYVNKVRALLLAGIRSAVLWKQVGGSRWQLFISRQKYMKAAQYCLNLAKEEENKVKNNERSKNKHSLFV